MQIGLFDVSSPQIACISRISRKGFVCMRGYETSCTKVIRLEEQGRGREKVGVERCH
jgi:hypothetical protein